MKKKNQRISDLFYNNRFLLVFSIVVAVAVWLIVAVEFSPETTNTIKNVPVKIDYSKIQNNLGGLQPFGETDFTVDVTISGQKIVVESDEVADSISVTANTGYVNSVGTYSLKLDVANDDSYEIVDLSTDTIEVYFDYPKEKEVKIEADIQFAENPVPDGYFMDEFIFSEASTVRISGPETEVNKIEGVIARAEVEGNLRQSETVDAALSAVTKDGSTPKYVSFNRQNATTQITIPVYKVVTLPVTCGFSNTPSEYLDNIPFTVDISPATATFGIAESKAEGMTSLELASKIDFSKLNAGVNKFTISATSSEIVGGVVLDETKEFVVTVTVGGMASKTIPAPESVSPINVPEGVPAEFLQLNFGDITIVGPQEQLALIDSSTAVLTADFSNVDSRATGQVTVPVKLSDDYCWSYGEYTATYTIP